MNMDRKKELKEEYKNYRPEMGLFVIRHIETGKAFLEATNNIKGKINSDVFQLNMETFMRNRDLNKDWKRFGKDAFEVVILEKMEYDEDVPTGVAINEAVELAKRFGGDASGSFVNGVLGKIASEKEEKKNEEETADTEEKAAETPEENA